MSFGPKHNINSDIINKKFVKGSFSNLNICSYNSFLFNKTNNKGRDISPFRKYNNIKNQKIISTNKKIDSEISTLTSKSPLKKNNKSPLLSPFNSSKLNPKSAFQNNILMIPTSSKRNLNDNLNKLSFSPNPSQRNEFSPNSYKRINRIYKTPKNISSNSNRPKSNNLKGINEYKNSNNNCSPTLLKRNLNITTNNNSSLHKNQTKRSSTPILQSNRLFNKKINRIDSKSPNKKIKTSVASPILSNQNNAFYYHIKAFQNRNNHYLNIFKSKNIFKIPAKSKIPTIITMNINQDENNEKIVINQSSNNNIEELKKSNEDKDKKNTNETQNKVNNLLNISSQNPINTLSFKNTLSNIIPQIKKKILCMHEFSKTGYAGEDEKKINQDSYFVFHNFVNSSKNIFMGVCDGHGQVGQEVSGFLKENLPIDLNHALKSSKLNIQTDDISQIISETFIEENYKLCTNEMINSMLSGSTCVSVIYTPIKIISSNVGDSRAFMGKLINGEWKSFDLTRDHKPSLPDESNRILSKGGRIEPMKDDDDSFIGPPRVWLKEEDYPGLAMSRSFGDKIAHSVGVSTEPEIKEYFFEKEDKFFIISSDGLFEFISSQDIVNIVKDYYTSGDIVSCCEYLYKIAYEKWMKEEEVVDDITMIVVFLEDEEN